jgi:Arc/MetJ-type ribon-helix-helix transcriptional regulator
MSEEWTINLPDDVSQELKLLDDDRVSQVISDAVREALGLAEGAEERRDELRERMGLSGQDSEELTEEPENAVEQKQAELRQKIREGR